MFSLSFSYHTILCSLSPFARVTRLPVPLLLAYCDCGTLRDPAIPIPERPPRPLQEQHLVGPQPSRASQIGDVSRARPSRACSLWSSCSHLSDTAV